MTKSIITYNIHIIFIKETRSAACSYIKTILKYEFYDKYWFYYSIKNYPRWEQLQKHIHTYFIHIHTQHIHTHDTYTHTTHAYVYTHTHIHIYTYPHIHTYIHTHKYTHTYTHTYIYAHIHILSWCSCRRQGHCRDTPFLLRTHIMYRRCTVGQEVPKTGQNYWMTYFFYHISRMCS